MQHQIPDCSLKDALPEVSFQDMLLSKQMNHTGLLPLQLQLGWPQYQI